MRKKYLIAHEESIIVLSRLALYADRTETMIIEVLSEPIGLLSQSGNLDLSIKLLCMNLGYIIMLSLLTLFISIKSGSCVSRIIKSRMLG